jgi:hypothetical protein
MIYILRNSPYNEDYIGEYATNDEGIRALAKQYIEITFSTLAVPTVTIDHATKIVEVEWVEEGEKRRKTLYLTTLQKVQSQKQFPQWTKSQLDQVLREANVEYLHVCMPIDNMPCFRYRRKHIPSSVNTIYQIACRSIEDLAKIVEYWNRNDNILALSSPTKVIRNWEYFLDDEEGNPLN